VIVTARQYKLQLEYNKRWRDKNPDYMRCYYASHPDQYANLKKLSRKQYWRIKKNPKLYRRRLLLNRQSVRRYAAKKSQTKLLDRVEKLYENNAIGTTK
jgi:molecular chaperone GrpE (heat shock protein)